MATPSPPPTYTPRNRGLGLSIPTSPWTTIPVTSSTTPFPPSPNPTSQTSLALSRIRFILRATTTVLSFAILAMASISLHSYNSTNGRGLMFAGSPVWPGADEDATPPELSLVGPAMGVAAGTVGAAVGAGVMIAGGVWEKVRRGGGVGDVVGLVAGAVVGTMMVAVGVVGMEGGDGGLMGWSCARREVVHPLVDLGAVCDEMGGMVGLAWVVVGGEVLGLMGIIAGWVLVGSREVRGKEVF